MVDNEMANHPNGEEEIERERGEVETQIVYQLELYADEEDDGPEIKRKKRMAREALKSWKETIDVLRGRILLKQAETRSVMNELYQLVSLYGVFAGVVFTAVATSTRLECKHVWSPISLCCMASSIIIILASMKLKIVHALHRAQIWEERNLMDVVTWVHRLQRKGYADFDFGRDCRPRDYRRRRSHFWRNELTLIIPLTIFTVILVVSVIHILCWN